MNQDAANTNSFGNYLDKFELFILESISEGALYADALLQWTYDSSKYEKDNPVSGHRFSARTWFWNYQSPFANIRWNLPSKLGKF